MHKCCPEQVATEGIYLDRLPYYDEAPGGALGGSVFNLNARCKPHKDGKDWNGSLLLFFGDYKGGELALPMSKLVLKTSPKVAYLVNCKENLHMNLDFTGNRASYVFSTDSDGKRWVKGKNGWSEHIN